MDKEPTIRVVREDDLMDDEEGFEVHFGQWSQVPGTHKAIMFRAADPAGYVRVRSLRKLEGWFGGQSDAWYDQAPGAGNR